LALLFAATVNRDADTIATSIAIAKPNGFVESIGATTEGTYAVPLTLKIPTTAPDSPPAISAPANTRT